VALLFVANPAKPEDSSRQAIIHPRPRSAWSEDGSLHRIDAVRPVGGELHAGANVRVQLVQRLGLFPVARTGAPFYRTANRSMCAPRARPSASPSPRAVAVLVTAGRCRSMKPPPNGAVTPEAPADLGHWRQRLPISTPAPPPQATITLAPTRRRLLPCHDVPRPKSSDRFPGRACSLSFSVNATARCGRRVQSLQPPEARGRGPAAAMLLVGSHSGGQSEVFVRLLELHLRRLGRNRAATKSVCQASLACDHGSHGH